MRASLSAVALALGLLAASVASAATPRAGGTPTALVIKVKSHVVASFTDDRAPKGESNGDRYLVRDSLVNAAKQFGKRAGAVVGHDSGIIVRTGARSGMIVGVTTLPGGTIRFQGSLSLTARPGPPLKVTGGTGRYARATGSVVIGPGGFPLNTYRLTLPV
ncbi:MAG TPA: hypothetical protein VFD90_18605 [Gaiellales bacterium]|nr:hypothetical protein [Gaiellales bacterium]